MRCLRVRFLLTSVCFLLPFVAMTSTSEAGVIPWVYDVIFGPNYGPRGSASYGPSYYGPSMSYGTNYGWSGGGCSTGSHGTPMMAYRPAYGCCDPCPVACGPCGVPVAGNCGVTTPAAPGNSLYAIPNNSNFGPARSGAGAAKTFAEPDKFEKPAPASGSTNLNNSPSTPSGQPNQGFEPRKPRPAAPTIPPDNEERETRKPAATTEGDSSSTEEKPEKPNLKSPAATPKINEGDDNGTEIKPASRTSQKIAWAPMLQRRHVSSQPQHGSASIVRLPAYPKTNELRQPAAESTIAKK